jgi:hypothetical protein
MGKNLEMHGPGKETLQARVGTGFGEEDGGKEIGAPCLGPDQQLDFGVARRDFIVQAE